MGNYAIVVIGDGIHHNSTDNDADVLFKEFITKMKAAGQSIKHASITTSAREEIE